MKKISKKSLLTVSLVFVLALAAGVGAFNLLRNNNSSNSTDSPSEQTPQTITDDPTSGGNATKSGDQPASPDANQSNPNITLEISNSFQQDNGDLVIQTSIKGASSGTCKLTLTKGAAKIEKSAGVLYQSSFSSCKGFVVGINEFSSGGTWQAKLVLEQDSQQVASTQKDITITK